jgi:hypothetical protein
MSTESRRSTFYIALAIIAFTVLSIAAIFLGVYRLPFVIIDILGARNSVTHWVGWAGAIWMALYTPVYSIVKRRRPVLISGLLRAHVIGNLIAVMFVSVHFAHQVTRPANNYPDLGTGIVLYIAMILLVSSGFMVYFGYGKRWFKMIRQLHPAVALTFYLIIIMHIIHGI